MSTTTSAKTAIPDGLDATVLARVIEEGYGPGAWHGPDLKAALADVPPELAFWRPAPGRHCIAEIALHHAYCTRCVRGQLSGTQPEPFVLEGVDAEQRRLATVVADIAAGRVRSSLGDADRFELVLGITCHAVYHAGQVQLIKRLH